MYDEKNTDCALYGTEECRLLNSEGCLQCSIGKLKPEQQQSTLAALGRLMETAPEETVRPLYDGCECRLCKGSRPNKADRYALLDMVKDDPKGDWTDGMFKKRSSTGRLLLPLQVSACKKCCGRYRAMEFVPTIVALVIVFAGLFVTTSTKFYDQAYAVKPWLPVLVFLCCVGAALLIAFLLRRALAASNAKKMHVDVEGIEEIAKLKENGWREVDKKTAGVSKLVFTKKFREHGVYSRKTGSEE